MNAVAELAPTCGTRAACQALALPRATLYRWRRPPAENAARRPRPPPSRALSTAERSGLLDTLHEPRFADRAPAEVFATLLDEGRYQGSIRTMYRVLHLHDEVRERRSRRPRTATRPELLATGPNQVWSWDITKLKGPTKWTYFHLYVMIDIYSRMVVGWLVAERESAELAAELIRHACEQQGIGPHQLTIHADRGAAMTAKSTALLCADLGIVKSHSRPSVSNDNPFSESQFATLKSQPDFPPRFGSVEDGRAFGQSFFPWYNHEHHHWGLGLLTPAQVHEGRVPQVIAARAAALLAAYKAHPERFVAGAPTPKSPPTEVWINPPKAPPPLIAPLSPPPPVAADAHDPTPGSLH